MFSSFRSLWNKSSHKSTPSGRLGLEILEGRLTPASFADEVNNLFRYTLNRGPGEAGLKAWTARLESGQDSVEGMTRSLLDSAEHQTASVKSYFDLFLNRAPSAPGLNAFVRAAQAGASHEQLVAAIVSSKEFSGETSNQQYVGLLYSTLLARDGDTAGMTQHEAALAHGTSRYELARGFLESDEYSCKVVKTGYSDLLGREGSPKEIENWSRELTRKDISISDVMASISGSKEGAGYLGAGNVVTIDKTNSESGFWWTDRLGFGLGDSGGKGGAGGVEGNGGNGGVGYTLGNGGNGGAGSVGTTAGNGGNGGNGGLFQGNGGNGGAGGNAGSAGWLGNGGNGGNGGTGTTGGKGGNGGSASAWGTGGSYGGGIQLTASNNKFLSNVPFAVRQFANSEKSTPICTDQSLFHTMAGIPGPASYQTRASVFGAQKPFMLVDSSNAVVEKWSNETSSWNVVEPLPRFVPFSNAKAIAQSATIHPQDILRITPMVLAETGRTRLFDIVGRGDLPETTAPVGVPGQAQNLLVAPTGVGTLLLTWDAPTGPAPTSYSVTIGNGTEQSTSVTTDTSISFTGLSPNNTYNFVVVASNAAGSGPAATTTFVGPENPNMGPPGTATMHANSASSDATTNPGPGSGAVTILNQDFSAVFPTILMGSDGMIVAVATKWSDETPTVYLLDPTTLDSLATMKLVKSNTSDLAGGIYSYLDNQDRLVLVTADGNLQRISHSQQASGAWQLTVESSVSIGYPDVVGLVPDYQGCVWFATAQGTTSTTGAVVGYYDPATNQTYSYTLPEGEQVANSISSSPAGVAVASTAAVYLFQSGSSGAVEVWRQNYDNGPARKPGQLSWGTGATPSFFGPNTGYEYLTITDNASPQENILVYSVANGSLIGSVPFLTSGVNSGNEDAAIAVGNSIYYPSTYGYPYPASAESGPSIPTSAPFVGGMQRVDVLADGSGLTTIWANQNFASAAEPRLSLADNLIYTVGLDTTTGVYSLITVNPTTGTVVSSTPYGSAAGDNPLQMVSMISPSGVLYQGTERGLIRVQSTGS